MKFLYFRTFAHFKEQLCFNRSYHVAIVGSGPAGFYTAYHLLKHHEKVLVSLYDASPFPFGLVRYGVAPDHPDVKNVINTFTKVAENPRFSFHGNVQIGKKLGISALRKNFNAVVLAYGSSRDRRLNIPGENLAGVHSARSIVGWYNGLPEYKDLQLELDQHKCVVIIGVGNVALDIARIFLTPANILKSTDISDHAMACLQKNNISKIYILGRRGPLQTSFSTKELREVTKIPNCSTIFKEEDFNDLSASDEKITRANKRLFQLMKENTFTNEGIRMNESVQKYLYINFLQSPISITSSSKLLHLKCCCNTLEDMYAKNSKISQTKFHEDYKAGLIIKSIGYSNCDIDDEYKLIGPNGVIANEKGCVDGFDDLFCSGWIKRGSIGDIGSTMIDAFETSNTILSKLASTLEGDVKGHAAILPILSSNDVQTISFEDWQKIDVIEKKLGKNLGKPREKLLLDVKNISKLLKVERKND